MVKQPKPNHYIKAWRERRRLSLRRLAARLEDEPGGKHLSHASLSRIEKGKQPYDEGILEALSIALGVPKSVLLEVHPDKEGKVEDLLRRLDERKRAEAVDFLEYLAKK